MVAEEHFQGTWRNAVREVVEVVVVLLIVHMVVVVVAVRHGEALR